MTHRVKTLQLGNKLYILNGRDPLKYVDLTTNKVHVYKPPKPYKLVYRVASKVKREIK